MVQLTIQADGSYTYVADQAAADALDAGDTVTDTFTYTIKMMEMVERILHNNDLYNNWYDDDPVGVNDTGYCQ